jgi:hypothetical protein
MEAGKQLGIEVVERHHNGRGTSVGVRALKAGGVDAYLALSDPMATNESQLMIDTARVKSLPT